MTSDKAISEPKVHEWAEHEFEYKTDGVEMWRRGNGCDWSPFGVAGFAESEIARLAARVQEQAAQIERLQRALLSCADENYTMAQGQAMLDEIAAARAAMAKEEK